jgi:integrase
VTRGEGRRPQDKGAFGTVSKLPSGRWRAMYYGPDGRAGRRYTAPTTFKTKTEARKFLSTVQADMIRNAWCPPVEAQPSPDSKTLTLAAYAETWWKQRDLKDRTREHYRKLLDQHILPSKLARLRLKDISADDVRDWYTGLDRGTPTMRAHCYGLLRTIMATAVIDSKIGATPCVIRGAGSVQRAIKIRPATLDELVKLVDAMPDRYKAMVLLASWCALRFGELAELRRKDIDIEDGVIRIRRGVVRTKTGFKTTTPKSVAGVRDVAIPPHLMPALRDHLVDHVEPGADSLLFPAHGGGYLATSTMQKHYYKAREAAGRPDLRFHDLRHTGAVLAASTGATLSELMSRLGHSSPAAALRYQHTAQGRDREIAALLSKLAANK